MNRIKELRVKKGLSQTELANETGISNQAISFYENGKRQPKIETWQKLAKFFHVPVLYLQGAKTKIVELKDVYKNKDGDRLQIIGPAESNPIKTWTILNLDKHIGSGEYNSYEDAKEGMFKDFDIPDKTSSEYNMYLIEEDSIQKGNDK